MAVATASHQPPAVGANVPHRGHVVQHQELSNWVDVCTAPETTDNSTNTVVNPGGITRAEQTIFNTLGYGRSLRIRLVYDASLSSITNPVVQPFGRDVSATPLWSRLHDSAGDHEITLTTNANDVLTDGTLKATTPVEVDLAGCRDVLVAIKTALAGTGTVNTSKIQIQLVSRVTPPPGEAVLSGSLPAGTNNIGDMDVASIAAGSNTIGGTRDAGPSWTVVRGVAGVVFGSADATTAVAVTDAPTAGQKLVITDLIVTNASASDIVLTFHEESTAATTIAIVALKAGTSQQFTPRGRWKLPTADKKLMVDASAAGQIYVEAQYHSEA